MGLESPGLGSLGLKSSWLKSLGLKSPGLESSWLKSLGLKGLGLKLGVEKSGVEMSFNLLFYQFSCHYPLITYLKACCCNCLDALGWSK